MRFSAALQKGENKQLRFSQDVINCCVYLSLIKGEIALRVAPHVPSLTSYVGSEGKRFAPVSPLPEVPLGAAADLDTVVLIRVQV